MLGWLSSVHTTMHGRPQTHSCNARACVRACVYVSKAIVVHLSSAVRSMHLARHDMHIKF